MVLLVASLLTSLSVCSIFGHTLGFPSRNVYFVDDTDDENNNFVQPAHEIHDVHDNIDFSVEIVEDTTTYMTDGGRQQLTTVAAELFESSGSTELSSTPADEEMMREAMTASQIQKALGNNLSGENSVTSTTTESSEVATIRNTDGLDVQILKVLESIILFISKRLSIPIPGRLASVIIGNQVKNLMDDNDIYLTYPGTNWCGALRQDGTGFGIFEETDKCCKTFMECPETIQPGRQYHGLSNNGFIRRSHCDCDHQFNECLKNSSHPVSLQVGFLYFNFLYPQCFINEFPMESCSMLLKGRCVKYRKNEKLPKQYQWVSSTNF